MEAITATGANSVEAAIYGIVPQIKPAFIGVATYRWDINVRASTMLGFVGAGGTGVELNTSINFFAWQQVLAILGVVIVSGSSQRTSGGKCGETAPTSYSKPGICGCSSI